MPVRAEPAGPRRARRAGAGKGLGRETARRLIELGHTVLIGARNPERGAETAATLGARFVRVGVTDDASVAAAAADVAEHEGLIDVLGAWVPVSR